MLSQTKTQNILFLDIETVPEKENFEDLDLTFQTLWTKKTTWQRKEEFTTSKFYKMKAGVMAEFAKIICISVGYLFTGKGENHFRIKSFYGDNEKQIISDFNALLNSEFNKNQHQLCAHNGKEFDFPFIARRMIINHIDIPFKLNLFGKKPWEVPHLDTLEMWKFGDFKHYTSLKLLTTILEIPSPKDDIDGSQVAHAYYKEKNLERIAKYCEKDTIAVAQLFLRFNNESLLREEELVFAE